MLRNRELQILVLLLSAFTAIIFCISFVWYGYGALPSPSSAVLQSHTPASRILLHPAFLPGCLVFCTLLLDVAIFLLTARRYRNLQKLSQYLAAVCAGSGVLDIRDNREGELSILKNDIYKVTLMLSAQAELLQKDKTYLADAISDISHQLKTPLTSMFVMTDLLSSSALSEEKRMEFTGNIHSQLERTEWLVSSLLKLSKIDAGAVQFKKELVSADDLIKRAAEPLLIPMELKAITFSVSGATSTHLTCDRNWTVEALVNIIKNCVEYTPAGGRIAVNCCENPLHTEISISDTGCGIPSEALPHVFERFYRVPVSLRPSSNPDSSGSSSGNADSSGSTGIGIGLSMAQSILRNQNAEITVASEQGHGTTFLLRFFKMIV